MTITLTNPNSRPLVTAEETGNGSVGLNVSMAIDYTSYYDRIATALETIATNSTAIKNSIASITTNTGTMATQQTTMAAQQTTMASEQTIMANLATGTGIHTRGVYETFGTMSLYRLLIEQAKILDYSTGSASEAQKTAAIAEMNRIIALIHANVPTDF